MPKGEFFLCLQHLALDLYVCVLGTLSLTLTCVSGPYVFPCKTLAISQSVLWISVFQTGNCHLSETSTLSLVLLAFFLGSYCVFPCVLGSCFCLFIFFPTKELPIEYLTGLFQEFSNGKILIYIGGESQLPHLTLSPINTGLAKLNWPC